MKPIPWGKVRLSIHDVKPMYQEKDDHIRDETPMNPDLETRIVEIAEDVIKRHHVLLMDDLFHDCTRLLKGINKRGIQDAIDTLLRKKILYPRATLTRSRILDNNSRASIHAAIQRQPGIHLSKIRRLLDIGSNVALTHLAILERFDLIRSKDVGNNLIYFDVNLDENLDKFYYTIQKGDNLEILKTVLDHPCQGFTDLFTRLSRPRSTLARKIEILEAEGFLILTRESNTIKSIRLNDEYREVLVAVLKDGMFSMQ
jgi:predicted transcriptional regulator